MIKKLLIVLFICACLQLQAQVNIITTIAGTDSAGYNGDGIPATAARLNRPNQLCMDAEGNIYIADAFNHRIRKIAAATGLITTVAGTGTGGYNGDNIPATAAQLFVPDAIAVDKNNDLYIADGLNYRIRKIDAATGIINTIIGNGTNGNVGDNGPATDAEVSDPSGIVVSKNGNVFFADYGNGNIRELDIITGIITRVVGNNTYGYSGDNGAATDANLNGPFDLFIDSVGNIIFSDSWNSVIRKVNHTTGIITTIAGNGVSGYSGDDFDATDCKMDQPAGIFVDKEGSIYVADSYNGSIRKITNSGVTSTGAITGVITTVAGTGVPGFSGDNGPATHAKLFCTDVWVDNGGAIYIADYFNDRIRRVNNALKVSPDLSEGEEVLRTYPNPTKGKFEVEVATGAGIISVCTMAGQEVFKSATFSSKMEIDISSQPPGIYMVYVQCGEDRYVGKVLLQ